MNINETLQARGEHYGNFNTLSIINKKLDAITAEYGQHLDATQKKAIDMIFHKVSRILNGNPHYADNWHDIAGYAMLGGRWDESEKEKENETI